MSSDARLTAGSIGLTRPGSAKCPAYRARKGEMPWLGFVVVFGLVCAARSGGVFVPMPGAGSGAAAELAVERSLASGCNH